MRNIGLKGTFLVLLAIVGLIVVPVLFYILENNANISGTTSLPLHTEGRLIKNSAGETVVLRGVWAGMFADTSTGYFGANANMWDESALRETCTKLRDVWGANSMSTFIWGDWWLENKKDDLGTANTNDIGLRDAIMRTAEITAEYGIYLQVRLYGTTRAYGRVTGNPFSPDNPNNPWTQQDFISFWANVASVLKDHSNVILTLFDEPTGNMTSYFNVASQAITAMRAAGFEGIICMHWGYCGDMFWVKDWINAGYPTANIVFSEHIYRSEGTFQWNPEAPVELEYIRAFMNNSLGAPHGTATAYILNTCNVPIWVSAIGAKYGATNNDEYISFVNTLQVLNEFGVGYVVFSATRTATMWTVLQDPTGQDFSAPNRVGKALIDAIKGIIPKPVSTVTLDSDPLGIILQVNDIRYTTHKTTKLFEGQQTITVPTTKVIYTHYPLNGSVNTGSYQGTGYSNAVEYTAGPYTVNVTTQISSINLYTTLAGDAKVAIYDSTSYSFPPYPSNIVHPNNLLAVSQSSTCEANSWNSISIPTTTLQTGAQYFLSVRTDKNQMICGVPRDLWGQYKWVDYNAPYSSTFGTISGGVGTEFAIYFPLAPMISSKLTFSHWEDNSTNPVRIINLTANMTVKAIYEQRLS